MHFGLDNLIYIAGAIAYGLFPLEFFTNNEFITCFKW